MTPEELLWRRRRRRERDETSQDDADDGALARIHPKTGTTKQKERDRDTRTNILEATFNLTLLVKYIIKLSTTIHP